MQQISQSYRFYFLNGAGLIEHAQDIESGSDREACELAELMLLEQTTYPSIEVWNRTRKVCRHP